MLRKAQVHIFHKGLYRKIKGYGNIFFCLIHKTFEAIVISVVEFFVTCL